MTNKKEDAFMYLNYGTMNNQIAKFQWRSEGKFNEYIDISIDDSFFVSRKINTLDGEYYLKYGVIIDLKCFFKTFYTVIMRDGYVEGAESVKVEPSKNNVKRRSINETSTNGVNSSIDDRAV